MSPIVENIIVLCIIAAAAGSLLWKLYAFARSVKKSDSKCKTGCDC